MMVTDHGGKDVKNNFFSLCVLCVCVCCLLAAL